MKPVLVIAALSALAACATSDDADRVVTYACEGGPPIVVTFTEGSASIASPDGPIILPQQPSGSGFSYGTPRHQLRGKGRQVTYTVGRMVPMTCTAPA